MGVVNQLLPHHYGTLVIFYHNNAKSGLQAPMTVSKDLAEIIGTAKGEKISRPQVTKKLWAYLKDKKLQDPDNRQWFTPDETMAPVFGTEKIKCFSMAKYLKDHLTKE